MKYLRLIRSLELYKLIYEIDYFSLINATRNRYLEDFCLVTKEFN